MAAGGILARLEAGPRYDWLLLMTAMGLTAAVLMRLLADNTAEREAQAKYAGDPLKDILDSAGTLVIGIGLDGRLNYVNPAAERLLGYHAAELVNQETTTDLLAPGEEERLVLGSEAPLRDPKVISRCFRRATRNLRGSRAIARSESSSKFRNTFATQRRIAVPSPASHLHPSQPGGRAHWTRCSRAGPIHHRGTWRGDADSSRPLS